MSMLTPEEETKALELAAVVERDSAREFNAYSVTSRILARALFAMRDQRDEARDARTYKGMLPVVAHPPCHLWVNFAALNFKRWGGEHNRPGNDGGKFAHALSTLLQFGGVLEHPASSKAFDRFLLPRPKTPGWSSHKLLWGKNKTVWVCEVWQSAYGHRARKRTWLLYYSPMGNKPRAANWAREPGQAQCGWFDRVKPTLGKREASATPLAFARYLVRLAAKARRP